MDTNEFVQFIREHVMESAADDVIGTLESPRTKSPSAELKNLSDWFKSLSYDDKIHVRNVARMAAHGSAFGWCCVIDGVRVFDDNHGELELYYLRDGQRVRLNPDRGVMLHDMLNSGPIPPEH